MPYIHRHVVCVCVWLCVCVSAQKGKPSCSTGGGLGDRMAIHSQKRGVCVWQKGKPSCSTGGGGGGGGFSFLPGPHAQLENHTTAWVGGEGMREEAEHKIAAVGQGDAAEAEGYPVPHRGGGGEYTMTSITY